MAAVCIPFLVGLTIAYLLTPLVDRLTAMGLRRDRVVIVLYTAFLGTFLLLSYLLVPSLIRELNDILAEAPTYVTTVNNLIDKINLPLRKFLKPVLGSKAAEIGIPLHAEQMVARLVSAVPSNLLTVAQMVLLFLLIPFVSFFALSDGKRWIDVLFDWTPSKYVESLLGLLAELNARLGDYIRGIFLESLVVGFMTMIGLFALDVQGAVLYGVLTGLVNVVPFLAPVVGGGLALLAAIIQGKSTTTLLGIFCLFLLVRLIDDMVLIPFVVGSNVRLHPLLMVFSVLVGAEIFGFLGLVFAIPVVVILKVVLMLFLKSQRDTVLLKHQSVLS